MKLEDLPDDQLEAIASGNLEALPDQTLEMLAGGSAQPEIQPQTPERNIFQQVVDQSRAAGMQGNFIPTTGAEGKDFLKVLLKQGGGNIAPLAIGANMIDKKGNELISPELTQTETPFGQNLDKAATTAQLAYGGAELAGLAKTGIKALTNMVPKAEASLNLAADQGTMKAREVVKTYARDLSQRFGDDYVKAIGDAKIDMKDYSDVLEQTAAEAGILGRDPVTLSANEKKFIKYLEEVRSQVPEAAPVDTLLNKAPEASTPLKPVAEVDQELKGFLGKTFGKQYGQGDHILSVARNNISNLIAESAPELKVVKAKYAPQLQMKNEAIKTFQPWNKSGSYDTTRGANFLKRVAMGNLAPDEQRLVDAVSGYDKNLLPDLIKKGKDFKAAQTVTRLLKLTGTGAGLFAAGKIFQSGLGDSQPTRSS